MRKPDTEKPAQNYPWTMEMLGLLAVLLGRWNMVRTFYILSIYLNVDITVKDLVSVMNTCTVDKDGMGMFLLII